MTGLQSSVRRGRGLGAFTLLEVLVTLALIALLSGLLVGGAIALVRDRPTTGEEILRSAIAKTRRHALERYENVRLSYDAQGHCFVASAPDATWRIPVTMPGNVDFSFLPVTQGSVALLGGDVVETSSLPYVTFYRDGGSSPFRAQIKIGTAAQVIVFDPWTCSPMPEAK